MIIKTSLTDQSIKTSPQKLYTQNEVDLLIAESETGSVRENTGDSLRIDKIVSDKNVIDGLIKKSNRILLSISSHAFPIDLFPDTINVEESRVTIINRHLLSSEVHSVDIKNISNVFINSSMFFSQLVIISKTFEENEVKMGNLKTHEAVMVRRIIEGLRVFEKNKINTSVYTKDELITKLKELSKTEIVM